MRKLLARTVPALAICAAVAVVAIGRGWLASGPPAIGDVAAMSESAAAVHRRNRYAEIASIEELMALPGHFARMEALYALAGRSDSADVQDLVFQAGGIVDHGDRRNTLLVLFTRLTELDPASALVLSRTSPFGTDPAYEREVWQRWGERDLEAALRHAAELDPARRNFAAQALLVSQGYWGNEHTARITERLGMEPDNRTRSARLDELARRDPAAAFEYLRGIASPLHRRQAAMQLGLLLGREGLDRSGRYAGLLGDPVLENAYREAAAQAAALADPAGTLGSLLADGSAVPTSRLVAAFTAVAGEDIEEALAWYARVQDPEQRFSIGSALAERFARADPERALAWARRMDGDLQSGIYRQVLTVVAESDPALAIESTRALADPRRRLMVLSAVARAVSESDPERAVALLDDVVPPREREMLARSIATSWLRRDPEAAVGWIFTADVANRTDLVRQAAGILANRDLDAALRMLPRVDEQYATLWRQQIASQLAAERSVEQARRFIADYEGSPEYPQMEAAIIQGVASRDAAAAVRMLADLPPGGTRQVLYTSVYMRYVMQDPQAAAESAISIGAEGLRSNLAARVVGMWAQNDPSAAERWVNGLPHGKQRDSAISGIASQWQDVSLSRRRMLESIADPMLRKQAVAGALFRIGRDNPERAERLLRDINLPPEDKATLREQLEIVSERMGSSLIGVW